MNLARQELPGMRKGHGPVPEGRLIHVKENLQSSLRDSKLMPLLPGSSCRATFMLSLRDKDKEIAIKRNSYFD